MKRVKKEKILKIIQVLFTIACLFSFTLLGFYAIKTNIVPNKYLVGYGILYLILTVVLLYVIYSDSTKLSKIIAVIVMTIQAIFSCVASIYLNHTYTFIEGTNKDYGTLTYSVVVLNVNNYENINDLSSKTVGYLEDDYKEKVRSKLEESIDFNENVVSNEIDLTEKLFSRQVEAIVLEESYLTLMNEEIEDFKTNTKVVYTFEVTVDAYEEASDTDITLDSFILYISGIDQYGNVNNIRGRSDVNQIAVVNPKTHHILLVNTPRDYYVELADTTGLKDKLTHAGIYGVEKSIKTLENFYEIDIDNYLRVNFDTLIKVVDVIGGIDIESDTEFDRSGVHVDKGWNHFNGREALVYARERKSYATGDNHRGANQQQVITAIIDKITSSKVLIKKYNSILDTLEGSFGTDMSTEMITSFIKAQINDGKEWHVEGIQVTGTGSSDYTYSMGTKQKLYVMEPNMNSVNAAKAKINEVFNEN